MKEHAIIELIGIRKEFPGVVALDGVNMCIRRGSVHALLGENGAGKSTLMKILSGTYSNYDGSILLNGKKVVFKAEKDALDGGISIVAQELNCIDELSIEENLYLGREQFKAKGVIDRKKRREETLYWLKYMGLDYDPQTLMSDLTIAKKQMVEILKAISRNCDVIIMDEPTSALTDIEATKFFEKVKELKNKGVAFVFISHRLEEVFKLCDEYTVLRDGVFIGSGLLKDTNTDALISMMVGRELSQIYPQLPKPGSETVFEVSKLTHSGIFDDISFNIKRGEILGFAGMMGAGRSEIAETVFGLRHADSGSMKLNGELLKIKRTSDAIKNGISMVTEDRAAYGFVGIRSIKDNIVLANMDFLTKHGLYDKKKISVNAGRVFDRLKIKANGLDTLVRTLSGGNQQKVVLAKWLVRDVKVMILDEPTRGIDVGAKQEIYKLITELATQGMAILLISSDMPEVLSMSHRVLVLANGKMAGELKKDEMTQDKVLKMIVDVEKNNEANE